MDTLTPILKAILGNQQVVYLLALIGANLILGVVASIKTGDFRLTALANWLFTRVIPLIGGYAAAALIAYANPQLSVVRDGAFATLTLALLGYVFANLRDMGVPVPQAIGGKATKSGGVSTTVTMNATGSVSEKLAQELADLFAEVALTRAPSNIPTPRPLPTPPAPPGAA